MIPTGIICLWHGAVVNVPDGWHLCDGTAGTPDLRDKFLVGAAGAYAVGASGGAATHLHTFTGDGHSHTWMLGPQMAAGADFSKNLSTTAVTGTTNAGSSLPPYYALAYIMKL